MGLYEEVSKRAAHMTLIFILKDKRKKNVKSVLKKLGSEIRQLWKHASNADLEYYAKKSAADKNDQHYGNYDEALKKAFQRRNRFLSR